MLRTAYNNKSGCKIKLIIMKLVYVDADVSNIHSNIYILICIKYVSVYF